MKEKTKSNQRRDDVLRRMLHTSPQPKTGGKSLKNLQKKHRDASLGRKPLQSLRESESEK